MVETYTTGWTYIENGDTTYNNPNNLVNEDNINILSADIQWEGSETTSESTNTDYSYNNNYASATATESTDTDFNRNDGAGSGSVIDVPSVPTGYDFDHIELEAHGEAWDGGDITVSYNTIDGGTNEFSVSSPDGGDRNTKTDNLNSTNSSYVGDPRGWEVTVNGNSNWDFWYTIDTYGTDTTINSDTSSTSYPSVPSGYDFSRHYYRIEKNNDYQESDYYYTNKVGDSKSVTSNDPDNTWDLQMRTRGEDTTTSTTTHYTKNPSVSGDVSASSSDTLSDNETSNWITLSGLSTGDNQFNHSIDDSNQGYYRITFDWEISLPTKLGEVKVQIGSTSYSVALVDTADSGLEYSFYRTKHPTEGVLAYDVVDPSDPDALPYYIYHPTYGKLALREQK